MTRLRSNIIANFAGQGALALIQLVITPVYVAALGIEAYGLLGFQLTLQALAQVLDFGLSPTVNRELARLSGLPDQFDTARDFIRTLEVGYWLIGGIVGAAIFAAAPYLGGHWLQRSTLPVHDIQHAIQIMAVLIAIQWPLSFYQGGLLGLQRHAALNVVKVLVAGLAATGGYVVVRYVSRTVTALFWWQCAAGIVNVAATTALLWHSLPASSRLPRIRLDAVTHIRGFAGGMAVVTVTSLAITQLDRVLLSRLLPLDQFGYYVLAGVVSNGLALFIRPVFTSIFPRFSALAAVGDRASLERIYRRGWQLVMTLTVAMALVVVAFPVELLLVWTRNPVVSESVAPLAALLILGTAINGLMTVPFALQVASGWTSLSVKLNLILTAVAAPAIVLAARHYGAAGAAAVWPALMVCYFASALPLIHRRLLPELGMKWFFREVALPVCSTLLIVALCRALLPRTRDVTQALVQVGVAFVAAELTFVLTNSGVRRELWRHLAAVSALRRSLLGPGGRDA